MMSKRKSLFLEEDNKTSFKNKLKSHKKHWFRKFEFGQKLTGGIYLQISVGTQWTNAAILVQIFLSDITANHRNGQIFAVPTFLHPKCGNVTQAIYF